MLALAGGATALGAALLLCDAVPLMRAHGATAPVWSGLEQAVRCALAGTCHERPERALKLGGVALVACARCAGLHASGVVGGALAAWGRLRAGMASVCVAAVALLADVGLGWWAPSWDHPYLRFATGLAFGTSVMVAAVSGVRQPEAP